MVLARGGFSTADSDNVFSKENGNFVGTNFTRVMADYVEELPLAPNAALLVRHLNLRLAAGRLPEGLQRVMIDALNATPVTADSDRERKLDRIAAAVLMVMASPEYLVQK
jgi:hypothetical protein